MTHKTKTFLSLRVCAAALLAAGLAPATAVVTLPGSVASVEGNAATPTGAFFGSNSLQVQISESELMAQGLLPGFTITGLRWRLDAQSATNASSSTFSDLEILLGQAVNTVAGMSATYADNIAAALLVHDGAHTFLAGEMTGGGSPNAFGPAVAFSSGYEYQGGDLVLQVNRQPATVGLVLDAASSYTGGGTLYQALTGSFGATSGALTTHFPVMQLQFETPEPTAWGLMLVGLAGCAMSRRRWWSR